MTQAQLVRAIEPESPEAEGCQVHSRLEIVNLLREVADAQSPVTISFDQDGEFVVTSLLAVNPDSEELIYDLGADAAVNQRLLRSAHMTVVTFVDNIRLQFAAQCVEATMHEHVPALRIGLPDSLLRLQRRDAFRLRTPAANPLFASVAVTSNPRQRVQLRVLDLSCGGLALQAAEGEIALKAGTILKDCCIELPDVGVLTATLKVRNVAVQEDAAGKKTLRCGCQFSGLPPAMMSAVQRYISKVERERAHRR
jgi:c-di-GMP-binding flagellar brake protein YcgR